MKRHLGHLEIIQTGDSIFLNQDYSRGNGEVEMDGKRGVKTFKSVLYF